MSSVVYDDRVVRWFVLATLFWVILALAAGVVIAAQLAYPELNIAPHLNFGRLRPVHTTGVIFAFAGNVLFGTSLYVVQRTCACPLAGPKLLHSFVFFGYQLFLVMAMVGYPLGITQGKEYAEPEWHASLLLVPVWVAYIYLYLKTLTGRKEKHIYVANWFYMAFMFVIPILHLGNNVNIPISMTSIRSVSVFSGVQSAMIQWWYGHNAVGFLLTAGFLGVMYYFVPKRANRPIYSYRLSILHFWALIFLYIWAGPHHLFFTSLPDWAQTLGMTMSIILWVPSWGGMINGIMTLSGAWYKLREDHVLRFLVISLAFYGMATFEGPLLAIKSVNALSHYTDWTISHVHSGGLGWVALISFGALYDMIPKLWGKREMYSMKLVSTHLWLASVGIILYVSALWVAGIMQGLMWRNYDELGFLKYSYVESVIAVHPYYVIRAVGGFFFLLGAVVMCYNSIRTIIASPKKVAVQDSR